MKFIGERPACVDCVLRKFYLTGGEETLSSSALKWSPDDPQRPVTYIHFFFFFYLFQLNCLQCRNVELPLKTHLFLTTLTRHKHTLTYSPFNRLDPYVFAGYDLFVCSDQSCQRCLKTTNRQQVTTAETKALEEAHGAKEIIGRRDCWCVQVWLWGADGA